VPNLKEAFVLTNKGFLVLDHRGSHLFPPDSPVVIAGSQPGWANIFPRKTQNTAFPADMPLQYFVGPIFVQNDLFL